MNDFEVDCMKGSTAKLYKRMKGYLDVKVF